ncbi:MAG: hypothetical protein H0U38_08115 [Chloroflexia bacterium]|jgi:hypothetical protein|nr:hypothetical protein [Chloroflexia bacterium]
MIVTFEGRLTQIETMTREELGRYANQGHTEDIRASVESIRRSKLTSKWRFPQRVPDNVVPFRQSRRSVDYTDGGEV